VDDLNIDENKLYSSCLRCPFSGCAQLDVNGSLGSVQYEAALANTSPRCTLVQEIMNSSESPIKFNALEALGLAAGIVAAKRDLYTELSSRSIDSPFFNAGISQTESQEEQRTSHAIDDSPSKSLTLPLESGDRLGNDELVSEFETYKNHFSRKLFPNLSEFGAGYWQTYQDLQEKYNQMNPDYYGRLGNFISSVS
jgi:hypothetical protein